MGSSSAHRNLRSVRSKQSERTPKVCVWQCKYKKNIHRVYPLPDKHPLSTGEIDAIPIYIIYKGTPLPNLCSTSPCPLFFTLFLPLFHCSHFSTFLLFCKLMKISWLKNKSKKSQKNANFFSKTLAGFKKVATFASAIEK